MLPPVGVSPLHVVALLLELTEGGGVEVQPLDADADLVGPQLPAGVEALGGLGKDSFVVEDAMQPGRIAGSHGRLLRILARDRMISGGSLGQTGDRPPTVSQ